MALPLVFVFPSSESNRRPLHDVYTWAYIDAVTKAPKKRIKVAVYLDPKQKAALEKLTERTRVPWATYVREGVNMVLAKYKRRSKTGAC